LSRVQIAGFDQKIDVFGALEVKPVSSGYCLGSANFVISTGLEKICYISGSSTLTTQAKPINQNALKNSDVIIMSGLTQAPHINPDAILGDLCLNVVLTLRNNGTVLIPCYPSGVIYDLFEILSQKLDDSGLSTIPMYFISPVAENSLAYSNILAEWLSSTKQNKVYIPDEPFPHANLVKNNRLKFFKHIYSEGFSAEFRQPCVIFCGHPSLRFGDIAHLIEQYGSNSNHTIIFTEPDFPFLQALAPYHPLNMKVVYCPIETSLNFQQANKLIKDLKTEVLVIPKVYTNPPNIAPNRDDLVIDRQIAKQIITFKCGDCIKLPLKRKKNQVFVDPDVALSVIPQEVLNGVKLAPLSGILDVKDNIYNIRSVDMNCVEGVPKQLLNSLFKKQVSYEYGTMNQMDIDMFLNKLKQEGITDIKTSQTNENDGILTTKIKLVNEDISIDISDKGTHIHCGEGKQNLRIKIRDALLSCLNKF
jgi:integrator complex subunit 9